MRAALLFLSIASTASADLIGLDTLGPLGFSYWHEDHWDHNGIHVDPPQSVPEASPTLVIAAAGAALILRRNGGAK
jgi:hypothetical protein